MNHYKFKVKMSCYNCVGAVIKSLKYKEIQNVNVSFDDQLVYVQSELPKEKIIEMIGVTGKRPIFVK